MKASSKIRKVINFIERETRNYTKSPSFKEIANQATIDFVKRVQRGLMPDLGRIPKFDPPKGSYVQLRKRNKTKLGEMGKVNKSNATATGQMLKSIKNVVTSTGFIIFPQNTSRSGELSGAESKLTNAKVASFYAIKRKIFDFSKPELVKLTRKIRLDILKIIRSAK